MQMSETLTALMIMYSDPEWWAQQLGTYLVFGFGIALATALFLRVATWLGDRRNRGWTLTIVGYGDSKSGYTITSPIYSGDVREFRQSDFSMIKFIRSVCTGAANVKLHRWRDGVDQGWIEYSEDKKKIVVDFNRIPNETVARWLGDEEPFGRAAVQAEIAAQNRAGTKTRDPMVWFVGRHAGAVDWAAKQGHDGVRLVDHLDPAKVMPGDTVLGTLPTHIAAEVCARGAVYRHLRMDVPAEARGRELGADDMERFGARLEAYSVKRLPD